MIIYYDESILTYVSSIRKYFGLDSSYPTNKKFDEIINKNKPEKIFLFLMDGMGANLIERKLSEDSFLRKNLKFKTQTVFPTTTTAATTSIRNGKGPNENAWLGWTQYIKEFDDVIIPFLGIGYYNGIKYGNRGDIEKLIPITDTETELNALGIGARKLFPEFEEDGCFTLDKMCERLINYSKTDEYRYIYAYWDKYDTLMHMHGPNSKIADSYLEFVNDELENLADNLDEDTMLVIVADHGQIEVESHYNLYGSKYDKYFVRKPALETRCQCFYIKEGMEEQFEKEFKEEFEERFVLLNKRQVKETHLFGDLEDAQRFDEFIGDYIAIAKTGMCFKYDDSNHKELKGQHAGMMDDEIMVPVIIYQK